MKKIELGKVIDNQNESNLKTHLPHQDLSGFEEGGYLTKLNNFSDRNVWATSCKAPSQVPTWEGYFHKSSTLLSAV